MSDIQFIELQIINRITGFYDSERREVARQIPASLMVTPLHREVYEWCLKNVLHGDGSGWKLEYVDVLHRVADVEYLLGVFDLKTWIGELKEAKCEQIMQEAAIRLRRNKDVKDCFNQLRKINEIKQPEVTDADELLNIYFNMPEVRGVPSGIPVIDQNTKQLIPHSFWVIGGYSSMGKTSLVVQLIYNLICYNRKIVFYSLEMKGVDIMARLYQWAKYNCGFEQEAKDYLRNTGLEIMNNKNTLDEIIVDIESRESVPDMIFIDYLQIIEADGKSEYEKLNTITRSLKLCTLLNPTCIIALSQVSNEYARSNQRIGSFKGSGSIIANSDVAIELRRGMKAEKNLEKKFGDEEGELKDSEAEIMIWKNRLGKTAMKKYPYNKEIGFIEFNPKKYEQRTMPIL